MYKSPQSDVANVNKKFNFTSYPVYQCLVRGKRLKKMFNHILVEIYVLEGVFSDENGDYPAGTYIRNPPGSRHKPFTKEGCVLFVKLEQFQQDDLQAVVLTPEQQQWHAGIGNLTVTSLHAHNTESTALVHWPANEVFQPHTHWGGEEIVVISGKFIDEYGEYPAGSWLRSPHMSKHFPKVEEETLILVKVGHLPAIE